MQITSGSVAVTNGSAVVTGTDTTWLTSGAAASQGFTIAGSGVSYTIASVTSNTSLTLSANYTGVTASGITYVIFKDFTSPDSIPEVTAGDVEVATILTRAVRKIQDLFTQFRTFVSTTTTHNFTVNGDYTLTAFQEGYGRLTLTDTTPILTSARNVIVSTSAVGRWYLNNTAQILTVKTIAGTGIALPVGASAYLICDGTNVVIGYNLTGFGVTSTAAELNTLNTVVAGVASQSKAVVLGTSKNLDTLSIAAGGLRIGAGTGTAILSTAAELNTLNTVVAGVASQSKALVVDANKDISSIRTIRATNLVTDTSLSFRNKIIGGDFTINPWQRGTSFAAIASNAYFADRWRVSYATSAVVTASKVTDAPTVAQAGTFTQHCMSLAVTTADTSIAAGDFFVIDQRIEGLNAAAFGFGQAGSRDVTLSFWVKGTKTGTYCVSLRNSASNRSYVAEYTIATTNTWEYKTITIPVDTAGTWLYDTGIGLELSFTLMSGTTFQTTANTWTSGNLSATTNQVNALDAIGNTFKIALVQLEAGSVNTPFDVRSVGQENSFCQRYYYRNTAEIANARFGAAFCDSTITAQGMVQFPVSMRIRPTAIEHSGVAGDYSLRISGGTAITASAIPSHVSGSNDQAALNIVVASGLTTGQAVHIRSVNAGAFLGWSAEL